MLEVRWISKHPFSNCRMKIFHEQISGIEFRCLRLPCLYESYWSTYPGPYNRHIFIAKNMNWWLWNLSTMFLKYDKKIPSDLTKEVFNQIKCGWHNIELQDPLGCYLVTSQVTITSIKLIQMAVWLGCSCKLRVYVINIQKGLYTKHQYVIIDSYYNEDV